MRNFFVIFVFIVFFIGSVFAKPSWINNIESSCSKNEICQVGSGGSVSSASKDARENISRYFEVHVNSKFRSNTELNDENVSESAVSEVAESTDSILKSFSIKETYKDGDIYYVFATLDKNKMASELKMDIDGIDAKMIDMLKRKHIFGLQKLYTQRDLLNKKYMFLTNNKIADRVTYNDISNIKSGVGLKYYINKNGDITDSIANALMNIIIENGESVVDNKMNANRIININISVKKEYLNVDGFEKYKVLYKLENIDANSIIGAIGSEYVETGRSMEQVVEKANRQFDEFLLKNYDKLLK
ncbi:MAG: LPP20 family lipoprotein [Rickettsiales bacterium]|jgi:hypothetical protein|nr:LPP20 family lipoprotein [Rickettsiales bacterium]